MWRILAGLAFVPALGGAQEVSPTEGYLPRFSRVVPRATRAVIPLNVTFPEAAETESHPVTFGVPFPRGALQSADHARLLEDGAPVPASVRRTATWHRPDGDVKWLLIDATVRRDRRYSLEYGTEVTSVPVGDGIVVDDSQDELVVTTGPLRFSVSRGNASLISSTWLDDDRDGAFDQSECVVRPGAAAPPVIIDHEGRPYPVRADGDYRVTVEQSGPLHVIIKVGGWFTSDDGTKLCQHIARLHAYAGKSFIRIEHTFVVASDTDEVRLRDIALPIALSLGRDAKAVFGMHDGNTREVAGDAHVVQDAADHFVLRLGDGTTVTEGTRAAGWVDWADETHGVTLGIRRMWEEFPRELELTGGGLVAHLWPVHHERLLDFDARAVLGPELYQAWDRVYYVNWYENGLDQYDQAYGLAKSNELILAVHAADTGPATDVCRTLDEPVIVAPSPEWMCRSDVMGPIHPRDTEQFPDEEHKMDLGFERLGWLRKRLGNYGLLDFGDVNYVINFNEENGRWVPRPWRRFASRFYGHPVMPWVQFLRSGRRDYLQWGIDNARHVMDIDMCHLTNEELGKRRGGRYGGNGGILHYAGNIYDIGCDSHVDHLLLSYYLTGYRRAWDVLQEEADFYLWKDDQPGGTLHRWGHRMTGGALRTMIALYQATWDERYLAIARQMAQFCYENQDEEGVIRHDDVYMLPGMLTYYQATGDGRIEELILRCMRRQAKTGRNEGDPRSFGFYGLSMAYFLTDDPLYLPWAERWRRDFVDLVQDTDDPLWRGQPKGEWDYCYLTLHLLYMPYYLEALAALDEPVGPATRDSAVTSGEVILRRESREPFNAVAEWYCYDSEYGIGVSVTCLDRYVARHPSSARVVLRGLGGEEVASAPVVIGEGQRRGRVLVEAPEGPPGSYRLGIEDTGGVHLKLRLASTDLAKWAYTTQDGYLACADAYHFYVPADAERFELSFKSLALRRPVQFAVFDSSGALQRREEVTFAATPQADYMTWEFEPPAAERGKLWRFTVSPANASVEQTYLRFKGVPPIVWTTPGAFLDPDADAIAPPTRPELRAEPYPGAGMGRRVLPDDPFTVPRGAATAGVGYENLDPRQGTLEFWFRPEWPRDDISDRTILQCGEMRLYRRSSIGIYLGLGGTLQSGLVTEPGHWYHMTLTWDAGTDDRAPETQLFINGVKTGSTLSPAETPLGDWTGEDLLIGGPVAFTADDARVSDVVRYTDDFDPPTSPKADEHTLWLERF